MTTLAEVYLHGRGGSSAEYVARLNSGQRIGQAFFNSLSQKDQERLRGTIHDPFHFVHGPKLIKTIEWLLDTEDKDANGQESSA